MALFATAQVIAAEASSKPPGTPPLRVILVGASIGQEWKLHELPTRQPVQTLAFEAVQAWQFDKSDLIEEALMRPARKFRPTLGYVKGFFRPSPQPADVFVLKECSSYFPSDRPSDEQMVERWVSTLRAANKRVVLATTVPVTQSRARQYPGKQEGVLAFNEWLRQYAAKQGIALLDLEAAMRTDDRDRFLRDEYTSGDGTHLNRTAYDVLDRLLVTTLCQIIPSASAEGCMPAKPLVTVPSARAPGS